MKGKIVSIGPENDVMNRFVSRLSVYSFKTESYTTIEACVTDIVQGFDPDAILLYHQLPDFDAAALGHLLTEGHKQVIPFVFLIDPQYSDQMGRLSSLPGTFAVHTITSEIQQITNSLVQAIAQKQLFKTSGRLLAECERLIATVASLNQATVGFLPKITDDNQEEKVNPDEQIKQFRTIMRGRDLTLELQKSRKSYENYLHKVEKIRKFSFKS